MVSKSGCKDGENGAKMHCSSAATRSISAAKTCYFASAQSFKLWQKVLAFGVGDPKGVHV
jgi:hypothetical protein